MPAPILLKGFDGRPNVSKTVGWAPRSIHWPSIAEVDRAIEAQDAVALLTWRRFLPADLDESRIALMNKIVAAEPAVRAAAESAPTDVVR